MKVDQYEPVRVNYHAAASYRPESKKGSRLCLGRIPRVSTSDAATRTVRILNPNSLRSIFSSFRDLHLNRKSMRYATEMLSWRKLFRNVVCDKFLRHAARSQMLPQSISYGRFQKGALASIFPGSYTHLSLKDATEGAFRSVANG
jgi:hypothetical protein